jgi:hypothetical protein
MEKKKKRLKKKKKTFKTFPSFIAFLKKINIGMAFYFYKKNYLASHILSH